MVGVSIWIVTCCQRYCVQCICHWVLNEWWKKKKRNTHSLIRQWLMQFREAALNPSQNNTEAMAGFCDCSKKLSKQIIAEAEDSCHTITLSNCSPSTMNPRHMLLFYGVLFYGIHMLISAFCNTKILRQQYENISFHVCRSQVELTLLMFRSPGMRTAACQQFNIFSLCLKWLELLCQLLTTVRSTHTDASAHTFIHMHTCRYPHHPHAEKNTQRSA